MRFMITGFVVCGLLIMGGVYAVKDGRAEAARIESQTYAEKVQREVELKRVERKLLIADEIIHIALCESGMKHHGVKGDGGAAYGLLQIHEATFYELEKQAGMKGLYWKNPYDQVAVLRWALENGKANAWTCYNKKRS